MNREEGFRETYNPCDECNYSYSKNNQEMGMCKICEFNKLLQEPERKWIPVSERLPEEDGQYWITENWGGRRTCLVHFVAKHHISFEEFLEAFEIDAVAWKPAILPEPYKAGENE